MADPTVVEISGLKESSITETGHCLSSKASFTCFPFPNLPKELRLEIYQLMLPGPRHVHLTFKRRDPTRLGSKTAIPILLHLCKEAREVALKIYQLCFDTDICEPSVYFNFEFDTLHFGRVAQFGVEGRGRWFWQYDLVNRYRQIGCGRYEFKFFLEHMAPRCREQLRFLTISAHIVRYEEVLVKKMSCLLALERLSFSYSSTDIDVRRLHSADHRHNLRLLLVKMLDTVEKDKPGWRFPVWTIEQRAVNSEEVVGKVEEVDVVGI